MVSRWLPGLRTWSGRVSGCRVFYFLLYAVVRTEESAGGGNEMCMHGLGGDWW